MSVAALAFSSPNFTDSVSSLLDRVDYRLASTDADREAIFKLRYESYTREGTIPPSFARRLSDRYDDADNTWIFGVYVDDELASSIRFTIADQSIFDLPAISVFPDILEPLLKDGKTILDPTRFVTDPNARRRYPKLSYVTVRIALMAAEFLRADMLLATVRTEHQAFYNRVLGHQVLADARPYPSLTRPISLMNLDYLAAKPAIQRRYPFFRSTLFERRSLFDASSQPQRSLAARHAVAVPAELAQDSLVA
jgi:hypothetical protein